jgi:hypothetical protein
MGQGRRLKRYLLMGILLVSGTLAHGGDQGNPDKGPGSGPGPGPGPGSATSFLYTGKRFGIPVLKAFIKIENGFFEQGKPICQIKAHIDTVNLGFLFHINNDFTSVVDTEKFTPIRYIKEIDQGGFLRETKNYRQTLTFDSNNGRIIVEQKGEKREIPLPSNTYDPLSMFARHYLKEELRPGQDISMSIYDGVKLREILFHSRKERVKTDLYGEIEAVCLESTTSFSTFGDKEGQIRIWYTADKEKTPVLIQLDLPVGDVVFDLDRVERN